MTNLETAGCWFQFYLLRETQVQGSCWASFPYLLCLEIFRFLRGRHDTFLDERRLQMSMLGRPGFRRRQTFGVDKI